VSLPRFERVPKAEIDLNQIRKGIINGKDPCAVSVQEKFLSKREEVESKKPPGQRLTQRRKPKVDSSMSPKREIPEGVYGMVLQVLCAR